jgi:hypothetical protein
MDVEATPASPAEEEMPKVTASVPKKKKKTSYKNMMASMLESKGKDLEMEKESLRKVTGGGAFSKIEKI